MCLCVCVFSILSHRKVYLPNVRSTTTNLIQFLKEKEKAEKVGLQARKYHHLPATNGHHPLAASWESRQFWTIAFHECPMPREYADPRELCRQAPEFAFHWEWEKTASASTQEAQYTEGYLTECLWTGLALRRNGFCSEEWIIEWQGRNWESKLHWWVIHAVHIRGCFGKTH